MHIELQIKNYRCFSDSNPARLTLGKGFTGLIGANNSGKSSILKFFYEFRPLFETLSTAGGCFKALRETGGDFGKMPTVFDPAELFSNQNDRDIEVRITVKYEESELANSQDVPASMIFEITLRRPSYAYSCRVLAKGFDYSGLGLNMAEDGAIRKSGLPGRLQIGGLQQVCKILSESSYIGPFRNALNVGTDAGYFDLMIGQPFIQNWREYKTGYKKSLNETVIKLTEDIRHIFGFRSLDIDATTDGKTLSLFIDGKSYKLPELGSGISQFIVVLTAAAIRKPSLILIDEPETNLHPSLQLDFLTTLASYATEGVWFATHSLGLARASGNRIYSFRRIAEGQSEVREYETTSRLSAFLGELNFPAYSELGFNKILLVEGSTDVTTIQQFLRLYNKDHQIVLLPLGGNQLINGSSELELAETKRISSNVGALIDSERTQPDAPLPDDRAAFVQSCKNLGIDCHVLERRAIENYLSDEAVKITKGEKYRALGEYEKLTDAPMAWGKEENWRIARQMKESDLARTDLGEFLKLL